MGVLELKEEELLEVSGGVQKLPVTLVERECPYCKKNTQIEYYRGARTKCRECHRNFTA